MQIVNGKWVDKFDNKVDNFNFSELKEISKNVTALYGDNVTYSRINIVASLKSLTSKQENAIAGLLQNDSTISQLTGY